VGSEVVAPCVIKHGSRCWIVGFRLWPLYLGRKCYPTSVRYEVGRFLVRNTNYEPFIMLFFQVLSFPLDFIKFRCRSPSSKPVSYVIRDQRSFGILRNVEW